jgi:hypothetical protein
VNVVLILEITLPSLVAIIVLPYVLYRCIRKIQDALSDDQFEIGMGLGLASESESEDSPTSDRDMAMRLREEDTGPKEYRRNTFFMDRPPLNARTTLQTRSRVSSESSDW